jgi:hypothetical protein
MSSTTKQVWQFAYNLTLKRVRETIVVLEKRIYIYIYIYTSMYVDVCVGVRVRVHACMLVRVSVETRGLVYVLAHL